MALRRGAKQSLCGLICSLVGVVGTVTAGAVAAEVAEVAVAVAVAVAVDVAVATAAIKADKIPLIWVADVGCPAANPQINGFNEHVSSSLRTHPQHQLNIEEEQTNQTYL